MHAIALTVVMGLSANDPQTLTLQNRVVRDLIRNYIINVRHKQKEEIEMADYSLVKDETTGNIIGLWLRNPEDAQNRDLLSLLCAKHGLPLELLAEVLLGGYRVMPNTFDGAGGCFVMFGSAPTPGVKTAPVYQKKLKGDKVCATCGTKIDNGIIRCPKCNNARFAYIPKSVDPVPSERTQKKERKWWEFWK